CEKHARLAADFTREHDLLLIPSGKRGRQCLRVPSPHVESLQESARTGDERPREEPAVACVRRLLVVVEREVLGEREVQDEPAPLTVLGDVADTEVEGLLDTSTRRIRF